MVSVVNGSSIVNNLTGGTTDIQELAKNLTEASRAPKQVLIDNKKAAAEAKISSIGRIQASAKGFQDTLAAFGDARTLSMSPSSTDSTVSSFTYKSALTASAVDFSFKVNQLATDNRVVFSQMPTSGELTVNGTAINYTSLLDLRSQLNSISGYTATIVNASDFVISKGTGENNRFTAQARMSADFVSGQAALTKVTGPGVLTLPDTSTLAFTDATDLMNKLNTLNGPITVASVNANNDIVFNASNSAQSGSVSVTRTQSTLGLDAIIEAGGQIYTSPSNQFSDLIVGINIDVKKVSSTEVRLTSVRNTDALALAARSIVDGYNALLNTINSEIKFDADIKKRGGLANDFVTRNFMSQLRALTTQPISNYAGNGTTYTLADIGISTNRDGSWYLDNWKLNSIAQEKPEILEAVVATDINSNGILDRMKKLSSIAIDTRGDFQKLANKTQNTDLAKINDDLEKLNNEMEALQNRYLMQFTVMQNRLYEAQNTQSSLTNFMTAWTAGMKNG